MSSKNISPERIELRRKYPVSFGRRKSRSLNANQSHLMETFFPTIKLATDDDSVAKLLKEAKNKKLFIEIGFGDGEHLAHIAKLKPKDMFIGCEVFKNSFVVCLQRSYHEKIDNIRLYFDDSRYLLEKFPEASIDGVYILFPDPWPKKKQQKRRIVNRQTINQLYPLLKEKGFIRLGTDIDSYFEQMLEVFEGDKRFKLAIKPKDFGKNPKDHIITKYQQKALDECRVPRFLEYIKKK